ncbi:MAG: nucleotide exchange factor GrpE [Firmicutes bacterium]|nr:nucleotide exchange factor GrpE [Candidatus Colimorpha enterica]
MENENLKTEQAGEEMPGTEETPKKEAKKDKKEAKAANEALEKLKKECEDAKAGAAEINEKYTRMLAEYDNFRKRAQKEKDGIYTDAVSDVLGQILPIKDSLEMALAYADESKLSQGVTMTLNKFNETLTKLGVEEFGKAGDTFDPNIHNAVFHIEDENLGEGEIVEVLLKGYKKGDKVLRYAMVKVAN